MPNQVGTSHVMGLFLAAVIGFATSCNSRQTTSPAQPSENASLPSKRGPRVRSLTDRKFERTPERLVRGKYLANGIGGFGSPLHVRNERWGVRANGRPPRSVARWPACGYSEVVSTSQRTQVTQQSCLVRFPRFFQELRDYFRIADQSPTDSPRFLTARLDSVLQSAGTEWPLAFSAEPRIDTP